VIKHDKDQAFATGQLTREQRSAAPLSRRERNKQEKRRRIVAAARRLFATKGFAHTTTQEIAEEADIGAGTLFLYARSKEDLLVMVFKDEMIETSRAAFDKAELSAPLIDQLMSVFGAMVAYHDRDLDLSRTLLKEVLFPASSERVEDIKDLMRIIYHRMGDLLDAKRQSEGLRSDVNPRVAAETMFSVYLMVLLTWLRGEITQSQFNERLRDRLSITVDGLRMETPKQAARP
jgi:AcrR family transcriptional regulator